MGIYSGGIWSSKDYFIYSYLSKNYHLRGIPMLFFILVIISCMGIVYYINSGTD